MIQRPVGRRGPAEEARILANPSVERRPWSDEEERVLAREGARRAREEIASWPGYEPTPLRRLDGLAEEVGVGSVRYKDEAARFGLGAFKALGGAYAVLGIVRRAVERRTGTCPSSEALREGRAPGADGVTVCCATAGNHGRAVAWGAEVFGARCVIFLPAGVSERRAEAIAAHGAEIVRCEGGYDETLQRVRREAGGRGWHVVSDKSLGPETEAVARRVMEGYTLLVDEALEQMAGAAPPSHVFVQAGVGGLAAAVCARLWQRYGVDRPAFVAVESTEADCLLRSAAAGEPVRVEGPLRTMMGGLACREPSPLAWEILQGGADYFLAIPDRTALEAMCRLASGAVDDPPVVAGESGAAGAAGLLEAARHPALRELLGLDGTARVLLVGTEGATDPEIYEEIVGRSPDEVR